MAEHSIGGFKEVIKCVVVGDSGVGKTCLICAFACGTTYDLRKLVKTHQATVFAIDTYQHEPEILNQSWHDVDGCQVSLRLWDTFGHHDKDRSFAYKGADVIVLCFSVMRPNTLRNVHRVWNVEIQRCAPNVPVILCGTQADLRYLCYDDHYLNMDKGLLYRHTSPSEMISPCVGREVARDIGAPYYETSVFTLYGVKDVFINAARAALLDKQRLKFLNLDMRRIQKPLVQPPMTMPVPAFKLDISHSNRKFDIALLINNRSECDVTFLVQNQSIDAHRVCLVVASEFFRDLFSLESLAKLQTKKRINSQLRRKFPNRFSHTDTENLLDSDQDSFSTDTEFGSSSQDFGGDSFLSSETNRQTSKFPLSIPYDHQAVDNIEIRREGDESSRLLTFITLSSDISVKSFRVILDYLYSGKLRQQNVDLGELRQTAGLLQLKDLLAVINNVSAGHHFLNVEIEKQFQCDRVDRLRDLIFGPDFLTDITFEVDSGLVSAHKALLMVGCEMMYAMFSGDFIESASDIIPFPGISSETFKALQEYLYTGLTPSLDGVEIIGLIEVANRLCLTHLVHLLEEEVIAQFVGSDSKIEMLRDAITLLEPAELYSACRLSRFCQYTLSINYVEVIQHHQKLFKTLAQDKQEDIEKKRWPPLWYLKEKDLYEKQVKPLTAIQSVVQEYRRKRRSFCFCRWRRKHVITDPVDVSAR